MWPFICPHLQNGVYYLYNMIKMHIKMTKLYVYTIMFNKEINCAKILLSAKLLFCAYLF